MAIRVLTVEDDERIRASVKLALEDEGWIVDEAPTGEDAIAIFQSTPADVVLIDIMLPGIDGFELCRTIRKLSDVPIVMVTARIDTHDVVSRPEQTIISPNLLRQKNSLLAFARYSDVCVHLHPAIQNLCSEISK
jgi:CheY-like chemotaxis protein